MVQSYPEMTSALDFGAVEEVSIVINVNDNFALWPTIGFNKIFSLFLNLHITVNTFKLL
jgi:hypothetical protein